MAWEQPQTHCVFTGSSGRTVKIWAKFTRPDNSLPQKREEAEIFHAHAYRLAVKCYQPQIPFSILPKEPSLEQYSRLSYDPELMYRPDSVPFYLSQPSGMPEELTYREAVRSEKSPLTRAVPGYDTERAVFMLFEAALRKTHEEIYEAEDEGAPERGEDFQAMVTQLAVNCFHSGIPEEETVKRTIFHYYLRRQEVLIRQLVKNVYEEQKGFGKKSSLGKEQYLSLQTEEFMNRRYDFRYNLMSGGPEYREKNTFCFDYRPVTDRVLNSIALNAQKEGLQLWDRDVRRFVFSDRIPDYAPIEDYLTRLPVWDGKDRIRPLAARIPCDNVRWEQLFYTWFLSMVAHWQGRDKQHGNSLSPLLVGGQGCGKSTFCFNLLPPDLNKYYTDSIDFSKKRDAELYLTRFGLINIDEFDQVSARHQGFLKHLLQKPVVNVRKPHATQMESVKRYASFIATSNHTDLLGDPSGSRRFICIEVKGMIDNAQPIDYLQLYAQAVAALNNNERYWLTHEEEVSQMQANEAFQQRPLFEDLFFQYYRPASHKEEGLKISAGEIYLSLQKKSGVKLPMSNVSVFGRFLKKIGLKTQLASRGRLYLVVEK